MKLTYHSSSWRLVLLLGALLLSSVTHAQEPTQEQIDAFVEEAGTPSGAVILADIGIYDAKIVTQNDTTLTIGFDITNNADASQGDIKYGIDVIKASTNGQTIVDTLVANETLTLATHETQSKTLTYTVPAFLSGEYEIWLISRTTGGMMLGLSSVGTTSFTQTAPALTLVPESCIVTVQGETEPYTLYQGVDVTQDEVLSLSCTVTNPSTESITVTPTFETHRRTMYGELVTTPTSEETVTLKGSEEKTIEFTIPKASVPQSYDVSVHLTEAESKQPLSNKIVAHYVLRGGSATIQTVTLDKDAYAPGDTLFADIFWSPSADGFPDARGGAGTDIGNVTLSMSVTSADGTACIEPVTQTLTPTQMQDNLTAPVIALCTSPEASFTLMDGTGNTLDSRTIESPVPEPVIPTNTETPVTTPFWNMLTIAMLLAVISSLIILFVVIQMLRHAQNTTSYMKGPTNTILKALIFTVITGASMFGGVGEVGAVTFRDYTLDRDRNPPFVMYRNTYTASANKTTYYPGEIITLSGSALSTMCANNGGFPFTLRQELDGVSSYIINNNIVGGVTFYKTIHTTAPLKTGNYAINLTGCWPWAIATFSAGYYYCGTASIPITVTAPAVNCVGSWSDNGMCSVSGACGQTGTVEQTYTITTPASGGGTACPYANGATQWGGASCSTAICDAPDLISSNLSVPASGTTGSTLNFSATVSNIGNTTTGIGFSDNFSYSYTSNTGPWTNLPNIAKSPLASGGTSVDNGSYTPASAGTLYIQHCVDSANVITESVEVPNCTVSGGIVVSAPAVPPPPASCSNDTVDNCDVVAVSSGRTSGTCTIGGFCQYTCTNGTWGENNNSCTIPQCSDGNDNDGDGFTDFGMGGDPDCSNASDNTESSVITPPDLTASPRTVQTGSSATISWDTNNGNETLCTLVGGTINSASTLGNGTGSAETGSVSFPVLARTTYTLTCPSGSDTLTVEIVPVGTET